MVVRPVIPRSSPDSSPSARLSVQATDMSRSSSKRSRASDEEDPPARPSKRTASKSRATLPPSSAEEASGDEEEGSGGDDEDDEPMVEESGEGNAPGPSRVRLPRGIRLCCCQLTVSLVPQPAGSSRVPNVDPDVSSSATVRPFGMLEGEDYSDRSIGSSKLMSLFTGEDVPMEPPSPLFSENDQYGYPVLPFDPNANATGGLFLPSSSPAPRPKTPAAQVDAEDAAPVPTPPWEMPPSPDVVPAALPESGFSYPALAPPSPPGEPSLLDEAVPPNPLPPPPTPSNRPAAFVEAAPPAVVFAPSAPVDAPAPLIEAGPSTAVLDPEPAGPVRSPPPVPSPSLPNPHPSPSPTSMFRTPPPAVPLIKVNYPRTPLEMLRFVHAVVGNDGVMATLDPGLRLVAHNL